MKYFFILILFMITFVGCDMPSEPSYVRMEKVRFKGIKKKQIRLTANAVYYNPNDFEVDITAVDFDVFINGKESGHVVQNVTASMSKLSEFSLPLKMEFTVKSVLKGLGMMIGSIFKEKTSTIKMVGFLQVDVMGVDVKVPFEYEDDYKIKLFGKNKEGIEIEPAN